MNTPPKIKGISVNKKSLNDKVEDSPVLRQKEIHEQPLEKSLDLPNAIHINNLDDSFVQFIKNKFQISINGELIPIYHYSLERYHEYTQQWLNSDITNTPNLPFISITRESLPKKGTTIGSNFNIPTKEKFTLSKNSKLINGKIVHELNQISQPIQIDLRYNMSVFTSKLHDIDKINEKVIIEFASRQSYLTVFGHYMGVTLEDNIDNTIKELEKRRYYHHQYNFLLRGYLYEDCGFEKTIAINKINIPIITNKTKPCPFDIKESGCQQIYELYFDKKGIPEKSFLLNGNVNFIGSNMKNENYIIYLNNQEIQIPFNANAGDEIIIKIHDLNKSIYYKLYGELQ